ncbi:MAG: hypothetical protein ACXVZO_03705 [Gaiellaceae bacterium]
MTEPVLESPRRTPLIPLPPGRNQPDSSAGAWLDTLPAPFSLLGVTPDVSSQPHLGRPSLTGADLVAGTRPSPPTGRGDFPLSLRPARPGLAPCDRDEPADAIEKGADLARAARVLGSLFSPLPPAG